MNQTKSIKCLVVGTVFLLGLGVLAIAQAGWVHGQVGTIVYSVFVPAGYSAGTPIPLIMQLHGVGDRGTAYENVNDQDLQNLATDTSQARHPCILYAPQCPTNDQWVGVSSWSQVNYSIQSMPPTNAWTNAMKGLDTVLAKYNIDHNRIYLAGGSMGGYGAWYTLCKYPTRFAAAVPIAGGGDTNAVAPAANVPLWAFHGTNDPVVPVAGSRSMIRALTRAGGSPKFTEYASNQIDLNGYSHYGDHVYFLPFPLEPTLKDWIFSQSKTSTAVQAQGDHANVRIGLNTSRKVISLKSSGAARLQIKTATGLMTSSRVFDIRGALICR